MNNNNFRAIMQNLSFHRENSIVILNDSIIDKLGENTDDYKLFTLYIRQHGFRENIERSMTQPILLTWIKYIP